MAEIKPTIAAMLDKEIKPTPPEKEVGTSAKAPTKAQIKQVVEMLAKPWLHGTFIARIERATGLSHSVVKRIKMEYLKRRAELDSAEEEVDLNV